jgi:glyoxylase-like metal-dependent hydrolase (beta-lactamase superfamily II)
MVRINRPLDVMKSPPAHTIDEVNRISMKATMSLTRLTMLLAGLSLAVGLLDVSVRAQNGPPAWSANLADLRRAANLIPGRRPARINVVKFAESRRTKNFSVKGAPATPSVQARTAFQVVYADSTLMIDAGMDQQVHNFFGRGVVEPYDAEAGKEVERAVRAAKMIVVTHEHGDHVAGVIHTPLAAELAPKTILTRTQVQSLMTSPQMPEIKLTPELASRFIVVDYDKYLPVAPGIAFVKAPGHTPGSQMVFVVVESGREFLFIGDSTWHMDGVRQIVGKDAPWITEDQPSVLDQLRWLNGLARTDPNLVIIASHDEEQRMSLVQQGVLGGRFD